jgi:integrase
MRLLMPVPTIRGAVGTPGFRFGPRRFDLPKDPTPVGPPGPAWKTDGGLGVQAEWLVTEADGTVVHPDTLLGRWKRLVRLTDVPEIPLHGARHSYAELAFSSGVRLDVVSRALGHSSSAFTADQYSHDSDEAAAEAADRIGAVLRR